MPRVTHPRAPGTYEAVDAQIKADLAARWRSGYADFSDATWRAAELIVGKNGVERAIDRRLQALRRRGEVTCTGRAWSLVASTQRPMADA